MTPGMFLSQPGMEMMRVIPLRTHDGLNGIGNQIARLQRIAHAIGAHGNTVGHADGIETHAHQIGRLHALLDLGGQIQQVHIAGIAFVPHAGDADLALSMSSRVMPVP